ncbi:MAG TPA: lysylphosphatidylglycerol synthase transmembrane domain-containing protein [Gammaproteobacteria bacterium]|nr:lysylphosphatidylglycerol synthase transmembrane domain-containing protein [Gammaproteobacteria bacterium]
MSIKTTIKILLAIILCGILIHQSLLNFKLLLSIFQQPWQLGYLFLLLIISVLLAAWRWFRLNTAQGFGVSYRDTIMASYVGVTFNNLLPGSVGGDLFRINYLCRRVPEQKMAAALAVLADRVTGLLGIFLLMSLIGFFYYSVFTQTSSLSLFLSICEGLLIAAVVGSILILLAARFGKKLGGKRIAELMLVIQFYKNKPWVILECLGISVLIQLLLAYILFVLAQMLHLPDVELLFYAISNSITQIVNLIPISPGGIGVGEMAFAETMLQLNPGVIAPYATVVLAYRMSTILFSSFGIGIFLKQKKVSEQVD